MERHFRKQPFRLAAHTNRWSGMTRKREFSVRISRNRHALPVRFANLDALAAIY